MGGGIPSQRHRCDKEEGKFDPQPPVSLEAKPWPPGGGREREGLSQAQGKPVGKHLFTQTNPTSVAGELNQVLPQGMWCGRAWGVF